MLRHTLSDYHHYVERVRKVTLSNPERARNSNKEHALIVEALRNGNAELAEQLANEHMINTIKNISDKGLKNILDEQEDKAKI